MTFEEQFEQLQKLFDSSERDIEVLPPDEEKAKKLRSQGGEFSPLAAVLAGTGGVSINGILRLLGSGIMDFFERNERLSEMGMTVVAEDVFGGIYGLDKQGTLLYLAPDELLVEEFGDNYDELLEFACNKEDQEQFYRPYVKECPGVLYDELPADKGISVYPPLWSEAGDKPRSTAAVSMKELQSVEIEVMKKLNSQDNAAPDDEYDGGAE